MELAGIERWSKEKAREKFVKKWGGHLRVADETVADDGDLPS